MSTSLLIERLGRVQRLTLNRPEKRNALSVELCRTLVQALGKANEDASVGAILIDGEGRDFCAGLDLGEVLEADQDVLLPLHTELFTFGSRLRKPLVAAVHGSVLAGGLGVAMNAHVVCATSEARFGLTETKIGLWPYVILPVVMDAVGKRKAVELALTARIFGAEEARNIGLVDVVVPQAELAGQSRQLAADLAGSSAAAIADGLQYVKRMAGLTAEDERDLAIEYRRRSFASADFREGVAAFREKRKPAWPSHAAGR
jgi:enoyl-CoA hydratase/carnithine racemase